MIKRRFQQRLHILQWIATGSQGGVPSLTTAFAPHFGLLRILFGGSHNDKAIIEKGIIIFQDNSRLFAGHQLCEIAGRQLLYLNVTK